MNNLYTTNFSESIPRLMALLPVGLAMLLTAAACTRSPDISADGGAATSPSATDVVEVAPVDRVEDTEELLALSGDGLQLVGDQTGSTHTLAFGTDIALVENVLTELVGPPTESAENLECGSGPQTITQWPNGLVLHAVGGELIGWSAGSDTDTNLTTIAGLGIGSARDVLEVAYAFEVFESTLGTEFSTGSLFGLLSSTEPDATVVSLWAGTVCNFR